MTAVAKRTERSRPSDIALDDRLRYLLGLRFLMAAITVVFAIASPDALTVTSRVLVGVAVGYVAVTAAAEWLSQRGDRLARLAIAGMLIVDGLFLTLAVYGTGGSSSVLQFLVYLQLLAVSLLASSRIGLLMAAWDTILFVGVAAAVADAQSAAGASAIAAAGLATVPWLSLVALWLFALVVWAFGALNERDLRERRSDLEAVVRIGALLDGEGDPTRQASTVLDGLAVRYALSRGLVLGSGDTGLIVLAARGVKVKARTQLAIDPIIERAWATGEPVTAQHLDRATDPALAGLLKGARRIVIAPMVADGRPVGVIVLERRYGQEPGLEGRLSRVAAQVAATTAVNLRNAVLLRRVQDLDERDPLTGVANRRTFEASLQRAFWTGGKRGTTTSSVLFIDIDDFKAFNDTHGFVFGDALLVAIARRIEAHIRDSDVLARLGGDEFAILTQDASDLRQSRAMADRLARELKSPFVIDAASVSISASIGIAGADESTTAAELMRNADVAMYMVKAGAKGGVAAFDAGMPTEIRERRELATELQQAVDLDQLELRYQPIVNLATNTMAGVEALVRWRHPDRGLVAPGEFIQIAEEHGSILPIGRWVLREACRQATVWAASGATAPGTYVAVNVSAREVQEAGFVDGVREALADHDVGPGTLVIEITEAAFLRATPSTVETLQALRTLGVRVVIDDFGTGYFPLSHLRQFPVDALKIAGEFTQAIDDEADARSSALAGAIVAMARLLGIETVAEGIETVAQADWMRSLGCTSGQGYYFDRPLLAEDVPASALKSFAALAEDAAALAEEAAQAEAVAEVIRSGSSRRRRGAEKPGDTPPARPATGVAKISPARRRGRNSGDDTVPVSGAA
ncbi:MAG TPA: EAL domain-containing protein [Candidatus Limnocylindrales bacterium]